jgi:hypothetical protein
LSCRLCHCDLAMAAGRPEFVTAMNLDCFAEMDHWQRTAIEVILGRQYICHNSRDTEFIPNFVSI